MFSVVRVHIVYWWLVLVNDGEPRLFLLADDNNQ